MKNFLRALSRLRLEDQIIHAATVAVLVGVFFPWSGGKMLGTEDLTYSGLGFYTSFLGLSVFVLYAAILTMSLSPLMGGPTLLSKKYMYSARFFGSLHATALIVAALSVLTRVTFEFSHMEIRFGIYMSLIGSLVVNLYSFLAIEQQKRKTVEDLFHHKAEEHTEETVQHQPVEHTTPSKPEEYSYHRSR